MATTEAHGLPLSTSYGGRTDFNGMKFTTHSDLPAGTKLVLARRPSGLSGNTPELRASNATTVLATGGAWSSDASVFNYTLSASTTYYIGVVGDGSGTSAKYSGATYPYNGTYLDWVNGYFNGGDTGSGAGVNALNILSVDLEAPISATVMASTLTLSTTAQAPTVFSSAIVTPDNLALTLTLKSVIARGNVNDGTIDLGPGGKGSYVINRNYPATEGLQAATTKQTGRVFNLLPQEGSNVSSRSTKGL